MPEGIGGKEMGIAKALQNQGYEFDEECTDREGNAEIWINRTIRSGCRDKHNMLFASKQVPLDTFEDLL